MNKGCEFYDDLYPIDKCIRCGEEHPVILPRQREACLAMADNMYVLYGGATGGGKSVWLCREGIRLALLFQGNRIGLYRNELDSLKNTTLLTMEKSIDELQERWGKRIVEQWHRTDKYIRFFNGSTIIYGGLNDPEDIKKFKSLEVGAFLFDEANEIDEELFMFVDTRFRWKLKDGSYPKFLCLLASNPEPGWLKRRFVTPWKMRKELPDHRFIQALPYDNPYNPPAYVDNLLRDKPERWIRKYVKGNWDATEGQQFEEWDYDIHTVESFKIPPEWIKFRAIDHGQSAPTCCLWLAVDFDDNIFVYNEYYASGIVSSHANEILHMNIDEIKEEDYLYTLLPWDTFSKEREKYGHEWSEADEYIERGLTGIIRANRKFFAGLNQIQEYMKIDPNHKHPLTGESGSPRLFVFRDRCSNLILEIPEYQLDEHGKPKVKSDHAVDALRYAIASRPPVAETKPVIPYNSFLETRKRLIESKKYAEMFGITK